VRNDDGGELLVVAFPVHEDRIKYKDSAAQQLIPRS
jgi:hypothetical protein